VLAQFACTSLWFAGNAVMPELINRFSLPSQSLIYLTSAVQAGFILGTLVYAILGIADRYKPSRVFFNSALLAALANLAAVLDFNTLVSLGLFRFLTGFFLAGIYPVGMKIAADYYTKGLGKSLGFLVGALVLGTAFPHLLAYSSATLNWKVVIVSTSGLALAGGLAMQLFVPEGPFRKPSAKFNPKLIFKAFGNKKFRRAAIGYFGHMWELYAFWAFIPAILVLYAEKAAGFNLNTSLVSFLTIAIGTIGCVVAGLTSSRFGTKKVAVVHLSISALCCLMLPLIFLANSGLLLVAFLLLWGFTVVADSPMFSTMVASRVDSQIKGSALTIVNSIGYAITIVSIQLLGSVFAQSPTAWVFCILAIGPVVGLLFQLLPDRGK
jgi:MFS family permease